MKNTNQLQPVRLQRKRTMGYKMTSPNGLPVVYVGRPTKWGNPFKLTSDGFILYYKTGKIIGDPWCYWSAKMGFSINDIVELYEQWITNKLPKWLPEIPDISELKGKNLACWCALDQPCHADVLIELCQQHYD